MYTDARWPDLASPKVYAGYLLRPKTRRSRVTLFNRAMRDNANQPKDWLAEVEREFRERLEHD